MKGKNDNLEWGTWNAECDRCGFKFKAYDLREEWTGWMVCDQCYEPRHPQDFLRGMPDDPSVPWSRSDYRGATSATDINNNTISSPQLETATYSTDANKTLTVGTDTPIQIFDAALTTSRTLNLSTTGAKKNDTFTIYCTSNTAYSWTNAAYNIPALTVATYTYNGSAWVKTDSYPYVPIS